MIRTRSDSRLGFAISESPFLLIEIGAVHIGRGNKNELWTENTRVMLKSI